MSTSLAGKRVLITGAARGVGAAIARRAVDAGARVVLVDVRDDLGGEVAAAIGARYRHCDVTDAADWTALVDDIRLDLGGLDGLVNNAAVLHMGPLEEIPLDEARRILDVNIFGPFLGIRCCLPLLRLGQRPSIVNIGSIDGLHGMNAIAIYSASKWGLRGLAKSAAIELGRFGIRVNTIHPSLGGSEMFAPFAPHMDFDRYAKTAPPPKLYEGQEPYEVTPDDIAAMTLFLLSEDSAGCTGADFPLDGGFTAGPNCPGLPGF